MALIADLLEAFNVGELRGRHGEWVSGGPHELRLPGPRIETMTHTVGEAARRLRSSRAATVREKDLPALARELAKDGDAHLHKLRVPGQENLFDRSAREIPRSQMPQVPTDAATMARFLEFLGAKGMTAHVERRDPRTLQATQNQLEGSKVGKILAKMGSRPTPLLLTSRDGEVADGHHRWAASAIHATLNPGYRVDTLRVDASIDQLLAAMNEFGRREGIKKVSFGAPSVGGG